MFLFKRFFRDERGDFATGFLKSAVAIAFLSVLAANIMDRTVVAPAEQDRLAQASAAASRGQNVDRMATGSLARAANETKLDPCVAQPLKR